MRRFFFPAVAALIVGLTAPSSASAQAVTCKDGTTASASGRGACSHHGGVAQVTITVSCRDGTTAKPGRGACSHHGGVRTATRTTASTRSRTAEPKTPSSSSGETVSCRDGTIASAGRGACSHHGGVLVASAPTAREPASGRDIPSPPPPAPNAPANASARCKDGTYSFTAHRSGACSHHGGVQQWYKDLPVRWY